MEAGKVLIEIKNLSKHFPVERSLWGNSGGSIKAVDDVTFEIFKEETFGLVGESGCGKTTMGRLLVRLIEATGGGVKFEGGNIFKTPRAEMRTVRQRMQIVFQDPFSSLNPRMKVFDLIGEPLRAHRFCKGRQLEERVYELLGFVGLDIYFKYRYPHELSGGQRQRVAIARALALYPKFVVCDEPVSALDVSIQAQIINLLQELQQKFGLTYLFISHDLRVVQHISSRVGVMYLGNLVEIAPKYVLYSEARHPYTKALLSAVPIPDPTLRRKKMILGGEIPSPMNPPPGCRFRTRCSEAKEMCQQEQPGLIEIGKGHWVSCHLYV